MDINQEFNKLRSRYNVPKLRIYFDFKSLGERKIEASFNQYLFEVALRDRRVCRRRLLSLLHEICHAIQWKERRFVMNRRDTRKMYELELEAELFSIDEYEKLYAKRFGSCLDEPWSLCNYEQYRDYYKEHYSVIGFG
jgi:hypothetical protein